MASTEPPAPVTDLAASASGDEREQDETNDAALDDTSDAITASVAQLTLGVLAPSATPPAHQQVPDRTCVICLDAPSCTLLLPCRHMPLCGAADCAAALGQPRLCPLCRVAVADTIEVFI